MNRYVVIEIQSSAEGGMATPAYSYTDLNSAEAKYHTILASAAKSALPKHACILISDEGFPMRHECYVHETEAAGEQEG